MAELFASLSDVNAHLPANVQIDNSVDSGLQVDAHRLIVGQLVGTFPAATIASWAAPETTPDLIRSIAGRLIASKYYARLISGEAADAYPDYALNLYNEAISMLAMIRSGDLIVVDGDGNPITGVDAGSDPQGDVYPNDSTAGPMITIDRVIVSS